MIFGNAIDDFRIAVRRSVRMLLPSQGKNNASVVFSSLRKLIRLLPCPDFEAGPLAPEINPGGGIDYVGNIGTAHTRCDLDEIDAVVRVGFQKFGMGHAANQTEARDKFAIDLF